LFCLSFFFCEFSIQRRSELLFRRLVKTVDILDAYLLAVLYLEESGRLQHGVIQESCQAGGMPALPEKQDPLKSR
jgi:hypothetical protein